MTPPGKPRTVHHGPLTFSENSGIRGRDFPARMMSLITRENRLTKKFTAVPSVLGLPPIVRESGSISTSLSRRALGGDVDFDEGCILTKSVKYTHQLAHWVNAARGGDSGPIEELIEQGLCITPYPDFSVDEPCNLAFLEAFVHASLDLYAFIAITASAPTLDGLIDMVQADNDRRQQELDDEGIASRRALNFSISSFEDPEYELVALHPEHFLPGGSVLTLYDRTNRTYKNYVPADDHRLRESSDVNSPPLPPFRHMHKRVRAHRLNVFLVILNASIKFRRYFQMPARNPSLALPADVISLMRRTLHLVDLLYWKPTAPKKGSPGEKIMAGMSRRRNPARKMGPGPSVLVGSDSSEETKPVEDDQGDTEMDQDIKTPPDLPAMSERRKRRRWLAGLDLETRIAYGTALMCGHDAEYDPALFEDAFPVNEVHLYSDRSIVDAWQQGINSEG